MSATYLLGNPTLQGIDLGGVVVRLRGSRRVSVAMAWGMQYSWAGAAT